MKATALAATLFLSIGLAVSTSADEPQRATMRVQIATENSARSATILFTLEEGAEKRFGSKHPIIKVLVLPGDSDQIPIQISLVAETGQVLNSTIVYFTPETGAEFSLDADGVDAKGQITSQSN